MESLECQDHLCNPHLLKEMLEKLPMNFRFQWLEWLKIDSSRKRDLSHLSKWLEMKVEVACEMYVPRTRTTEVTQRTQGGNRRFEGRVQKDPALATSNDHEEFRGLACKHCGKENHFINKCFNFNKLTPDERWKEVKDLKLCFLCLGEGHRTDSCKSKKVVESRAASVDITSCYITM
jgi:hypothetical protein